MDLNVTTNDIMPRMQWDMKGGRKDLPFTGKTVMREERHTLSSRILRDLLFSTCHGKKTKILESKREGEKHNVILTIEQKRKPEHSANMVKKGNRTCHQQRDGRQNIPLRRKLIESSNKGERPDVSVNKRKRERGMETISSAC